VDAVLGGDKTQEEVVPPPTASGTQRAAAVARLRRAGIRGRLVYTDRGSCRLHTVRLPDLAELSPPALAGPPVGCAFELSAAGGRVAPRGAAWAQRSTYALCRGDVVGVHFPPIVPARFTYDGCVPAWRPTPRGALTVVRGQKIHQATTQRVLVPRTLIRAAAASHPNAPDDPRAIRSVSIDDVAWLSDSRVVVLLRLRIDGIVEPQQVVAVLEDGRLRGSYYFFDADRDGIEVGPHGGRVWTGGVFAFTSEGPRLAVPDAFGDVRGAAWSPDEQWLALAARGAIAFVRPGGGAEAEVVTVPIDAVDVAWR
jgi:hypothetical protein